MSERESLLQGRDRWHTQTILGGGNLPPENRGDCVRGEWWERLQAEVARHGYALAILDVNMHPPRCYWIASLPSLNLPPEPDGSRALHCVVARGYELVHDPGMVKPGYTPETLAEAWKADKIEEGWALVPLDPVELTA